MTDARETPVPIDRAYLLVVNIPYYVDDDGGVSLERSWHVDVMEHLRYLPLLRVASPCRRVSDSHGQDLVAFHGPADLFVPLPPQASAMEAVLSLPRTVWRLFWAVERTEIVHCAVVGWPYPLGWIAAALTRLRHRQLVVLVESAPWRSVDAGSWPHVVRRRLYEVLAGVICRAADLALFTQPSYRDVLHPRGRGPAYVTPATWIHADDVVADVEADAAWQRKRREPVRLLFAGRLVAEKGIDVLLEALAHIDADGGRLLVDCIGVGDREAAVEAAAARFTHVVVRHLAPVHYGTPFFALEDHYHAVVVPTLTDEQPRILFDAAARAIPVIASATAGNVPHVEDGETGILTEPGDVEALVEALRGPGSDAAALEVLGKNALQRARGATHTAMHARRSHLIAEHLGASRAQRRG
jgi:glycosyltransferase involved in cell wall biosynthesis